MSAWLRNIQGQLSDLANEVLNEASDVMNEATEEVADPDTELQVAKKNCAEAEKQLAILSSKVTSLEDDKKNLEQQLYDAHIEMDSIGLKFNNMIKQRDDEIKKLKVQLEQVNESGWNDASADYDGSVQQIADLQKEVAHWKKLVGKKEENEESTVSKAEFEKKIEEVRRRKEDEIQALIESHADSILELREMYEEKIQSIQVMHYNASSSTSNADVLDAVILEKEDLMEPPKKRADEMIRSKTSTSGSDGGERPVVVELESRDELADERIRQVEAELERAREEHSEIVENNNKAIEDLRCQNQELAQAYNDLNEEYEQFKRDNAVVETRNADLTIRIDSLKANLIEYEERYEICKRENFETVAQLEKLSADFERLRSGLANVSARRENCDTLVNDEVQKLRDALEESKTDRETLRKDVERFQVAVGEIDTELEKLRDSNRRLLAENQALTENMATYDLTMRDIISSSEKDIGEFKEQFSNIRETHRNERDLVLSENNSLREEIESLKRQSEYMKEESDLLREVNDKLKAKSGNEDTRASLFEQKIELLENLRAELVDDLNAKKSEIEELKANKDKREENETEVAPLRRSTAVFCNPEDSAEDLAVLNNEVHSLQMQLTEALKANTEKSEECEELRNVARNLEKEIEIRQNCVDEMIAQTNTLQMQQQYMTQENSDLKNEGLARERECLKLEQKLVHSDQKLQEMMDVVENLESMIYGESSEHSIEQDEASNSDQEKVDEVNGEDSDENIKLEKIKKSNNTMILYIDELKKKNKQQANDLIELKEKLKSDNQYTEGVKTQLEQELHEAKEVDMNLLAGIEKRVTVMEKELAEKAELLAESRKKETELQKVVEKLKLEINERSEVVRLETEKLEASKGRTEEESKMNDLMSNNEELKNMISQLELQKIENERVNGENVNKLFAENEQLKATLISKHEESVEYYTQLQKCVERNQQLEQELESLKKECEDLKENLARNACSYEKRERELERLKKHLMLVEETSTREAVEAEHRETELRARVRTLEATGNATIAGATESTQQYEIQISSLTAKLESITRTAEEWKNQYESETKAREQTQEALTSLQNVVRELSIDHEKDTATSSHRNLELQVKINALNNELSDVREKLDDQSMNRQAAEDDVEQVKLQLISKQKIIEDLEIQIEEIRSPAKSSTQDSYRVDDATLRQLFLNYFMADSSKRADIALLLASILEYPADEMEKFRSAVRNSFGPSSLSGRGSSPQQSSTLTEQFIRFLEVESESSKTAPHLPLRTKTEAPPRMSFDESGSSKKASNSNSAAALDSLLR